MAAMQVERRSERLKRRWTWRDWLSNTPVKDARFSASFRTVRHLYLLGKRKNALIEGFSDLRDYSWHTCSSRSTFWDGDREGGLGSKRASFKVDYVA